MDGLTGRAGAVTAIEGYANPVRVARAVMEHTPHVLLAGRGAAQFAEKEGFAPIISPSDWFTHAGADENNHAPGALAHGTVGCVVLDAEGRLAASTSTGGVFNKMPGRVGDTPIIGAGCFADHTVAVSCTGQGEYFIQVAAAAQVAHRMRFAGQDVETAARAVLAEIASLKGDGGLIAVDREGCVTAPFVSEGMKRALLHPDGRIEADAF
jgi:L-asparaginase/beta-aspartyl-peptidase (threonine type)